MGGLIWEALEWGGLIWYGACNGGPRVVRNVPNPAPCESVCRLRGSRGCNYSRTRIKRHRIKRSVFKVPKITSLDVL